MEQAGSKRHWLWKYQWFQEQIRRNPEDKDRLLHGLVPPILTASSDQGNSDPCVATQVNDQVNCHNSRFRTHRTKCNNSSFRFRYANCSDLFMGNFVPIVCWPYELPSLLVGLFFGVWSNFNKSKNATASKCNFFAWSGDVSYLLARCVTLSGLYRRKYHTVFTFVFSMLWKYGHVEV